MPPFLSDSTIWWSLLPIPATVILAALGGYVALMVLKKRALAFKIILPLSSFLLLGMVTGYLTGLSRESAVGAVLPAVLSLVGGVAAVLIARATSQFMMLQTSGLIFVFALGLLLGTTWGSAMRQAVDDFEASETELMRRSHIQKKVREFREALNLPPDMPAAQSSAKKATKDK